MSDDTITEEDLQTEFIQPGDPGPVPGEEYDQPSETFVKENRRPVRARRYEESTREILNVIFKEAVAHDATVPDAAAILMHGPKFCETLGDLADHDSKVRAALDWLDEGTSNPYLAFAVAALPFAAQVYRNHQDALAPQAIVETIRTSRAEAKQRPGREFKIPFTRRRITIRFRFHAPPIENWTNEPEALSHHVFTNPQILGGLEKAGITNLAPSIQQAMNGQQPNKPAATRRPRKR